MMDINQVPTFRKLAKQVFERQCLFNPYSTASYYARFIALIVRIQRYYEIEAEDDRVQLLCEVRDLLENQPEESPLESEFREYLSNLVEDLLLPPRPVELFPDLMTRPWKNEPISHHTLSVPGMLYPDIMRYYKWLVRTDKGHGQIVELGCWLGQATLCLAEGLALHMAGQRRYIHVVDSFRWENWMDQHVLMEKLPYNLKPGDSFIELFWAHCGDVRDLIQTHCAVLGATPAYHRSPEPFIWNGGDIGILVSDLSGDYELNVAAWETFRAALLPHDTIVVFNQYGNARAEGLRRFCRELSDELTPLHKVLGSAKAFRYRGSGGQRQSKSG